MVTDRLNPRCIKAFILGYKFPEVQPLKFVDVYDVDSVYVAAAESRNAMIRVDGRRRRGGRFGGS